MSAYGDGLKLLARRELSVAEMRARLRDREHSSEEIEAAIQQLVETGALDDNRVARAYARTASSVKGRGRLRVQRELQAMGIPREIAAAAIADVFGEVDERALIDKAIQKKLHARGRTSTPLPMQERARLYQFLLRQGFPPAAVSAALRRIGAGPDND